MLWSGSCWWTALRRRQEQLLDHSEIVQIRALLGSPNDRERMILRAHYGLEGPEQSLRDLGEPTGLSTERVRQIEQRAVGKLRAAVTRGEPNSRAPHARPTPS